jgi:hypothetical protein
MVAGLSFENLEERPPEAIPNVPEARDLVQRMRMPRSLTMLT